MNSPDISELLKDCPLAQKGQMLLRIYYYQKGQLVKLNEEKMAYYEQGHGDVWQARCSEVRALIQDVEITFLSEYLLMFYAALPPLI